MFAALILVAALGSGPGWTLHAIRCAQDGDYGKHCYSLPEETYDTEDDCREALEEMMDIGSGGACVPEDE